jgi:hypothetical protein
MKLSDSTLEWLIETRYAVDAVTRAHIPRSGHWCGTSDFWPGRPEKLEAGRAFSLVTEEWFGFLLWPDPKRATHRYFRGITPTRAYYTACRELQGLQPLYLIPNTPANAARIAAQALLICSLYQLAAWLGEVPWGKAGKVGAMGRPLPFSEPRHPEFAAYLLRELELAKKVGTLPLATSTELLPRGG